ncbi:MAG: alpha/beta hydrolase [Clostridia bacterium]|nr:alpha/beta hydrolase [Clostridia bacterium]
MRSIKMDTFDGKRMNVSIWDEVEEIKGAIVISHGMAEHSERYDDFANFLNKNGYVVLADDHRGHRYNNAGAKGIVDGDSYMQTVEDMRTLVEFAHKTYEKEVYLIGHSYGSFLSQRFIELYSTKIKACILSGTAHMKNPLIMAGNAIATVQYALFGPDKTGHLIDKMSFGAYNKPFEAQGQKFAWLSRDKDQVAKYEADEYCGYPLSIGFYKNFFKGLLSMYGEAINNVNKDFPILIAVGSDDPVSNKSVLADKLYKFYLEKGFRNVQYKVYEGARHEILNETNKEEVYADFLAFLEQNK